MSRPKPLPTYAEIARKARVSTKTVCNVFRYPDVVREKTEEKVIKALLELGVSDPTVMKTRLRPERTPQTNSVLFLESGICALASSAPVFSRIVHAAETRAHELGWQFSLHFKKTSESLEDALCNFNGKGVILFGTATSYKDLNAVQPGCAAVRLLAPPEGGADCDNADYDRREVPRLAAQHLHQKGCKKVAYMGDYVGDSSIRGRLFLEEAKNLGMQTISGMVDRFFLINGNSQVVDRRALKASWELIEAAHPDGIFVHSDQITNALYPLLNSKGIQPQRDIQIVSCNAEEVFLSPLHPRPTTIDIHSTELGQRCMDMLVWRMQNPSAPPASVTIRPKLISGDSDK